MLYTVVVLFAFTVDCMDVPIKEFSTSVNI